MHIDGPNDCSKGPSPNSDTFTSLTLVLSVEISQWRWDLSRQEKVELLEPFLQLLESVLLVGASRINMSAALATLAMLVNDHPEVQATELNIIRSKNDELYMVSKAHAKWEERYDPGSRAGKFYLPAYQSNLQNTSYSNSLLVLGLAGLLDSLEELGFADANSGLTTRIVTVVATQLQRIHTIEQPESIALPYILPATYDIKIYLMDVITRTLNSSPFECKADPLPANAKAALMRYLSEKKRLWFNFGSQLLMPVIQLPHEDEIPNSNPCA